jgi:ribosomal protein S18 acetylase RimI-like enzyme
MDLRPYFPDDLPHLIDLTIDTFGPFYEQQFRPEVGELIFAHQHGDWREDYRKQVPTLHDPANGRYVVVAETGEGDLAGYAAWTVDLAKLHGDIEILAVSAAHRRDHTATALCEHAFADMRARGVEVATIGTGGDPFHAPARALYEKLGCTGIRVAVYFKEL